MKQKKNGPSPFSYNPMQVKSKKAVFSSKLDRSGFIEDARARSKENPAPYKVKYSQVQKRLKGRGFLPTKKTNMDPIKKVKDPDMGSYTTDKAYFKIAKRVRSTSISKYNIPRLQDLKIKQKKYIPGVGSYKWEDKFDKITRAPLFKKGKY